MRAITVSRLGDVQRSALEIYVVDPIHAEAAEFFGEEPFPGILEGSTLTVPLDGVDVAARCLTDAANSADEDGDSELRDALLRIQARLRKEQREALSHM